MKKVVSIGILLAGFVAACGKAKNNGLQHVTPFLPIVSIAAPVDGATVSGSVPVEVDASQGDAKVELYVDGSLFASLSAAPFAFTWNATAAGSHSLVAKAYDASGSVGTSQPTTVKVPQQIDPNPSGPSGSLDSNFGISGIASFNLGTYDKKSGAIAIQSDGKIVVSGTGTNTIVVFRLNSDGSLDTSFHATGSQAISFSYATFVNSEIIQPDGKILVMGSVGLSNGQNRMVVVRLNADGSLDSGFGNSGVATLNFNSGRSENGRGIALQSTGKIIVSGFFGTGYGSDYAPNFVVGRVNVDGSLDTTFGTSGVVDSHAGMANAVSVLSDDEIIAVGTNDGRSNSNESFSVAKIAASGSSNSIVYFNFRTAGSNALVDSEQALSVAVQTDGKIVVAGYSEVESPTPADPIPDVARLNSDLSLDTSFFRTGLERNVGSGIFSSVNVQSDGRIVLSGITSGYILKASRLMSDGSFDSSFNSTGFYYSNIGAFSYRGVSVIQPDGKIVVFGDHNATFELFRLWP